MGNPQKADVFVLFGITGDLAKKMLFPALYRLTERGALGIPVVGVAVSDWTDADLVEHAHASISESIDIDEKVFGELAAQLTMVNGDFKEGATFNRLADKLKGKGFAAHYLAVPPFLFTTVAAGLAGAGLNDNSRLVVEKPFGHDLESARKLDRDLTQYFDEEHLFRVDHFLGNTAIEGLQAARFSNTLLSAIWNRDHVERVEINLLENFDVADRGSFYDPVGCVRDVVQNHLLQVFALVAMDPPAKPGADGLRLEKWRVLNATRKIDPAETVRGQYRGYQDVDGVKRDSTTETYVAARLWIDNWRWQGVPFYLRSGKSLKVTDTDMVMRLRRPVVDLFPGRDGKAVPNVLRFRFEQRTGLTIEMVLENPEEGRPPTVVPVSVDFKDHIGREEKPYENIFEAAITGNGEFFAEMHAIEECWRIVGDIIDSPDRPVTYEQGSWGPESAATLPGPDGWHNPPANMPQS
ncbi:glucose-6-phosphate dehydrogenase [Actinomadura macrotermitis]|uniref:Glucose-6-phosphate 1-dehydrogenase n=1 Tax=Actinomadura macrotermitis TaxID=2585200 RepID=A0A7K0C3C6_9ACTN|nr:glucose-6-phosphate dehydrogenase [Actinomadura macrotermitis]MQY07940.1 Glucose-6-phosphate 1-dehydrogenase 1 [Actinomadura macrotermitis]